MEFKSGTQVTLMKLDGPDLDALESTTCAQLQAQELGKIIESIPYLCPKEPVPDLMGKFKQKQYSRRKSMLSIISYEQSDWDEIQQFTQG